MNALRSFLAWSYAGIAAALAWAAASILRSGGSAVRADSIYFATALPTIALMAITAWLLLAHKRAGRYFGFAISLLLLAVIGIEGTHFFQMFWEADAIFLAYAVAGIVGFVPRKSRAPALEHTPIPAASEGDGTRNVINKSITPAAALLFIGFVLWVESYGSARGVDYDMSYPIAIMVIGFLVVLVHECGHALGGKLLGMRLIGFVVGPLQWQWKYGRGLHFKIVPSGFISLRGYTATVPVSFHDFRRRKIPEVFAGPFANLVTGLMVLPFAIESLSRFPHWWPILSTFVGLSFIVCVFSLIPHRTKCNYSDGAKIYQLVVGGLWADYERAISEAYSSMVSPLRARDWDVETMERILPRLNSPAQRYSVLLKQYACYLDRCEDSRASACFRAAESEYREKPFPLTPEAYRGLVFGNAFVLRDAARAREWWDQLVAKNAKEPKAESCLSYSALLWIENDLTQAREAWRKGSEWAEKLPKAGMYEIERNIARRLDALIRRSEDAEASGIKEREDGGVSASVLQVSEGS